MKWGKEWGSQLFLRTFFLIMRTFYELRQWVRFTTIFKNFFFNYENFLWYEAKSEVHNYF